MPQVVKELLQTGQSVVSGTVGTSMRPLLYDHHHSKATQVRLTHIDKRLEVGDLPIFQRSNGKFVIHRIIRVLPDGYIICGDNEFDAEYVQENRLLGYVTDIYRSGKWFNVKKHKGYYFYSKIWVNLFPLRRLFLPLFFQIKAALRKFKR
ncbi:S24/S26 family peptidase [Streptococcus merionis]|uniref:S24/S26 family peptidase n=1 Tax=Streptococcus merionis TaxID=400065 RepID=UPI003519916B